MKKWSILIIILVILVGIRLALPHFIIKYVNKSLAGLEGYQGSIEDVDLNLFRGAYVIDEIKILKKEDSVPVPFVYIRKIDLSIHWNALLRGVIAGEIILKNPELNFVVTETGTKQDGTGEDWSKSLKDLMPIRLNRFQIDYGRINYKDYSSNPKVDVFIDSLFFVATNISNANKTSEAMPATLYATGNTLGGGILTLDTRANLIKQVPDLDIDFKLENMKLKSLNDFMKAYTKTDVERGLFSLYIELLLDNGTYSGYIKPVFEDLKFVEWGNEEEENKLWQSIVGFFAEIFENQPKDQVASQIPLNGNLNETDVGIIAAIWTLLRNAFIESLNKDLEFSIGVDAGNEENAEKDNGKEKEGK